LISAAVATLCISNAGFIVNDILDIAIDRINRPDRPLAAGKVSVGTAWGLYAVYNLFGIGLAVAISISLGIAAVAIAGGLLLYSAILKKQFVIGHLMIAVLGGVLFPFGGLAAGHLFPAIYAFPVTFFAFFAREVLKTIPDAEGDKANGVTNITTRYGAGVSTRLAQIMLTLCALSLPLLRIVWALNGWFWAATALVIWPLTVFFLVQLSRHDSSTDTSDSYANINRVLRFSKLLFLLVAVAILIGSL
jgi:geranylgeranylglycerol-phosphate geranylgeranyltransferase